MNQIIIKAIKNLHVLSLTYDGISRKVEPHAYGIGSKGVELLLCYQIRGAHGSIAPHDWDWLTVPKISAMTDTGDTFSGARPQYKRDDKRLSTIYAQL